MGPCAFCRQTVDVPATCPRCRAHYHADCWVANEYRCAVYGCEPARESDPPLPRYTVIQPPSPSLWPDVGWVLLIAVALVSVGVWIGPTRPHSPPAPRQTRPAGTPANRLIADADWIAASMLYAPLPTDAEMRGAWRRNADAAIDRLLKARNLLSADEALSVIEPRLLVLRDLRARLSD